MPAPQVRHPLTRPHDIAVYSIPPRPDDGDGSPILLSYLDVVVQGFLTEFGASGVHRFFETTDNWDLPVADDRAAPLYPRAQKTSPEELRLTDDWLARLDCRIIHASETGLGQDAAP